MQGLHCRNCNLWCFLWTPEGLELAGSFDRRKWQFPLPLQMVLPPFYLLLRHFPSILPLLKVPLHAFENLSAFFCNLLDWLGLISVVDQLAGCKWFSTLDLHSGYWQIEMEPKDKAKTAFVTRNGLYQFNVMPFGLCNAPATFERLMELTLQGLHWDICLI